MAESTTEPYYRARIDGHEYVLDKLTLGDTRLLKRHFGLSDLAAYSDTDPDIICGSLYLCLIHDGVSHEDALERVHGINLDAFFAEEEADADEDPDDGTEELSPTPAAPARGSKPKAGGSATPPKKRGSQSSPKS